MKKKYKNTFWFSVAHAMKKNFILPLLTFAVSMFFYLSNFCWEKIREAKETASIKGQDVLKIMRDAYEVFIFDSEQAAYNPLLYIFPALLVVISILLGVLLFRFVTNKKTVNVYYSLGIKRADLYTARLLAGVFMMLAAVLVPLAVSLGLNLHYFGSSVMLWRTFLFYAVHNVICVLAGLTISAAVSSCVGTVVESIGFSAVLAAFPSVVTMCVNYGVPAILNGAPAITYYGIYPAASSYGELHFDITGSTVFGRIISHINLLMLNRSSFINSSSVEAMTKEAAKKWAAPSLTPYILWAVLIAAFFVFGLFMFKRRKAEICGFPGRSAVLNFVLCMITSFGVASLVLYFVVSEIPQITTWMIIVGLMIISIIIFLIFDIILHLSFKAIKKDWKIGLVHAGLMAAFLLSLYTGFFGYSSRVPDIQDIDSVSISAPNALMGSYQLGRELSGSYVTDRYYSDVYSNYYYVGNRSVSLIENFKDKDDINTVREIHKAMIKAGNIRRVNTNSDDYSKRVTCQSVVIRYKLKNGRELVRVYEYVPLTNYPTLYTLEDTKNWNSKIKDELLNIDSENVIPIVFSAQMDNRIAVDEELTAGLARAIYNDITTLSSDKFLTSNAKYLGSVAFYVNRSQREDYSMYESSEYVNATSIEDEITEEEEPLSRQETVDNLAIRDNSQGKYLALGDYSVIPITEEMTNTISFLKAHGLYEKLSDESPIVSARIADMGKATSSDDMRHGFAYSSPIFNSFWDDGKSKPYSKKDSDGYEYEVSSYTSGDFMPKDAVTITNKTIVEKLAANAYGYRFDLTGGYLVEFKRENGALTIMYVPKGRIELNLDTGK
ncbi:MAG: ABC transporter permease subunit [Acutalibacteraceae bacterium]|nr:ABC transporter permease subunit [Acutalibacteraceae bacterium]